MAEDLQVEISVKLPRLAIDKGENIFVDLRMLEVERPLANGGKLRPFRDSNGTEGQATNELSSSHCKWFLQQ